MTRGAAAELGQPPEFGSDGSDPPLESEPLNVSSSLVLSPVYGDVQTARARLLLLLLEKNKKGKYALRAEGVEVERLIKELIEKRREFDGDPGSEEAETALIVMQMEDMGMTIFMEDLEKGTGEPREPVLLYYTKSWRRDDPVTQLPPGASLQRQVELKLGASASEYEDLSMHLEIDISPGLGRLSTELNRKIGLRGSLKMERTTTETLSLTNPSDSLYRRFAFWHVVDTISICRLSSKKNRLFWFEAERVEIVASSSISITYHDIAPTRNI